MIARPAARYRRHPVRIDTDGDFDLNDLLALDGPTRQAAKPSAQACARGGHAPAPPVNPDADAMHHFETSGLFLPPVADRLDALTAQRAVDWLATAQRWIGVAEFTGDLRFLNTACKLVGAVWTKYNRDAEFHSLQSELATTGRRLDAATQRLAHRLAQRVLLTQAAPEHDDLPAISDTQATPRLAVLAGHGSRNAIRLVTAAAAIGVVIECVCWYSATPAPIEVASNYSTAWYPPAAGPPDPASEIPDDVSVVTVESWGGVVGALAGIDLILLVGMPIVPTSILDVARLGVLNAHNGILPWVRGMDAVGWALLHNLPIVCSLHIARPQYDTGEVIATIPVANAPTDTIAARVKAAQLRLLLAGASSVVARGAMPDSTPQPAGGVRYYRLHPHLKRLLDTSPYGRSPETKAAPS